MRVRNRIAFQLSERTSRHHSSAYKAHLRADEAPKNLTGDEAPEVREQHRARLLTAEQLAALDHMKRFTDFNDLKTK